MIYEESIHPAKKSFPDAFAIQKVETFETKILRLIMFPICPGEPFESQLAGGNRKSFGGRSLNHTEPMVGFDCQTVGAGVKMCEAVSLGGIPIPRNRVIINLQTVAKIP